MRLEAIQWGSKNHSRVVIRVLKYIKPPVSLDAASVVQKEGELLTKYNPVNKVEEPWVSTGLPKILTPSSLKLSENTYIRKGSNQ